MGTENVPPIAAEMQPALRDAKTAAEKLDVLTRWYARVHMVPYSDAFGEVQKACPPLASQYAEELRARGR